MNRACGLHGGIALVYRPGAYLVFAHGEEGHQPQKLVALAHHHVKAGLFDAVTLQEQLCFVRGKLGDFHLQGALQSQRRRVLVMIGPTQIHCRIVVLAQVHDHHGRLGRKEAEAANHLLLFLTQFQVPDGHLAFQRLGESLHQGQLGLQQGLLLVAGLLDLGMDAFDTALDCAQVRKDKLHAQAVQVRGRIDAVIRVRHIVVVKSSHDLQQGIRFAHGC